ncbi:cupin domain-containing protein [Rhizobium mongolense]|uniref:cupin domain-containing protein n=1 Tax=Rhizobium mongolense TaxID=57676 RepID=UPI003F5F4D36
MDPLSEFLSLLKPSSTISSGFDATGDWSIQFGDQHHQIKCYVILSGGCWLAVDGVGNIVRLEQGDCFVLPRGLSFRLASDLNLPSVAASTIFPPARAGGMVTVNGGGRCTSLDPRIGEFDSEPLKINGITRGESEVVRYRCRGD